MSNDSTQRLTAALDDRYRIEKRLGEGGMATVYLATDLKHERQVALKVLKPELAAVVGAERFLSEIKTTANLQHPHVLPLYDSGSSDGLLWYVMPYLEGESLRDLLDRKKQLGVQEAVDIAAKVADALDYAHEQGIVHRDVKPGNILLSDRGEPLVADFGIALAVTAAGQGRVTETGLSMGTPHYMSPEQATGDRDVDPRSDIWALGCVLFEMLAGAPPFAAASAQAVLAKILTEGAPDVITQRPTVPPHVAAALDMALQRLPADRFEAAGEFKAALYDPGFAGLGGRIHGVVGPGPRPFRLPFFAAAGVAAMAILAAVGFATREIPGTGADDAPVTRFDLALELENGGNFVTADVSSDGRRVLYANLNGIWLHDLTAGTTQALPLSSFESRFSEDGEQIVFIDTSVRGYRIEDGASSELLEGSARGATVTESGGLLFADDPGRRIILDRPDQAPDTIFALGSEELGSVWPIRWIEDSGVLVFQHATVSSGGRTLVQAVQVESGERATLVAGVGQHSEVVGTDVVLFSRGGFIYAQKIDLEALEAVGEPVTVVVSEAEDADVAFNYGGGTLLYRSSLFAEDAPLAVVDTDGVPQPLPNLPDGGYDFHDVSPDGSRIATIFSPGGSAGAVWVYSLPSGPLSRLSPDGGQQSVRFAANGEDVFFLQNNELWSRPADGARPATRVRQSETELARAAPHPDGRRLYLHERPGAWDIRVIDLEDPSVDSLVLGSPDYWEGHPDVSPDGRWLAYYSYESGSEEVYISSLEGPPTRLQISLRGGLHPRWNATGDRLYFSSLESGNGIPILYRAELDFSAARPRVTAVDSLFSMGRSNFDVFPGDTLFAISAPPENMGEGVTPSVRIILNFDRVIREAFEGTR